jgi:hypothetical protein
LATSLDDLRARIENILVGYTGAQQKNINTLDFAKNSIQANRDLLKQLTAQYISTAKPTQDFMGVNLKTLDLTLV